VLCLLAARRQVVNVHRVEKDIVLTYKSARRIKKLATAHGDERFRVVDEKSAYYRLEPIDDEPPRLYGLLKEFLKA
jgi:hypothetical protein